MVIRQWNIYTSLDRNKNLCGLTVELCFFVYIPSTAKALCVNKMVAPNLSVYLTKKEAKRTHCVWFGETSDQRVCLKLCVEKGS